VTEPLSQEIRIMNASTLALHTICYRPYGLDEALRGAAEAGFRAVELAAIPGVAEHVDLDTSPGVVRRRLDAFGLTAVSLSAHSDLTTASGLAYGIRALRWAAEYGLPIVNGAVGGSWADAAGEAAFLRNMAELADQARDCAVTFALEIDGIMGSGATARPVLERIGRDEVRVNYDTANCEFADGAVAVVDLPLILPYVAHVHLKDTMGGKGTWDFPALGEGVVDFDGVLQILGAAGYGGPISVEIEFQGDPWPAVEAVDQSAVTSHRYLAARGLA
jgi:L-ribulose-5-phosphate 3-epimerase